MSLKDIKSKPEAVIVPQDNEIALDARGIVKEIHTPVTETTSLGEKDVSVSESPVAGAKKEVSYSDSDPDRQLTGVG